jgi:hypothetical protein
MLLQSNPCLKSLENTERKATYCLEKYVACRPTLPELTRWTETNRLLCEMFYDKDKYEKRISTCQRVAETRRDMAKEHQLDQLDFEFIPRSIAAGNIGVYENIAVYVQAGILGLRPPKRLILLLDPKTRVNNICFLNYWRKYVSVICDPELIRLLSPLEQSLTTPLILLMPFYQKSMNT